MNDKTKRAANWLFGTDSYTPYPEVEEHEKNPPALFSAESRERNNAKQAQLFSDESKAIKAKIESGEYRDSFPIKPFIIVGIASMIAFTVADCTGASWIIIVLLSALIVADAFAALLFYKAPSKTNPKNQIALILGDLKDLKPKTKGTLLLLLVVFSALAAGTVAIARNVPKIEAISKNIEDKNRIIQTLSQERDSIASEINANKQTLNAINEFNNKSAELNGQLADVQAQIDASNTTLQNLTAEAQTKQGQIDQLNLQISQLQGTYDAAKAQGITLGSGFFYGGKDIPEGTYTIVHVSGNGNVFVHNAAGRSVVNEMFGNGSYYIKEFKNCPIGEGYDIQISGCTVKFVPA